MTWFVSQSLFVILLAFVLGLIVGLLIGWLWWGRQVRILRAGAGMAPATASPATASPAVSSAAVASSVVSEPVVSEPVASEPVASEPVASEPVVSGPVGVSALGVGSDEGPLGSDEEPVGSIVDLEPETIDEAVDEAADEPDSDLLELAAEPVAETAVEPGGESVAVLELDPATGDVDDELVADVESAFAAESFVAEPSADVESTTAEPAAVAPQDQLARIEGIGPKIAAALRAAGITTFAALADADRSTVEAALAAAKLRFTPSLPTWSRQARLLADGDEAGFKELTARLTAGRDVSARTTATELVPAFVEPAVVEPAVVEPAVVEPAVVEPAVVEPAVVEPAVVEPVSELAFAEPSAEPAVEAAPAVALPAVPDDETPPDDLKRIEGIGPKMSAALIAARIRTYRQLAASDVDTLRAAIEAADLRFAPSIVTWARQAQLLADGDEAGFADLTRRLVGGRDTGRA